jgi:hypothetical protein
MHYLNAKKYNELKLKIYIYICIYICVCVCIYTHYVYSSIQNYSFNPHREKSMIRDKKNKTKNANHK